MQNSIQSIPIALLMRHIILAMVVVKLCILTTPRNAVAMISLFLHLDCE